MAQQIRVDGGAAPFALQRLPPEGLREVVLRLNDHRDLTSSAQAYRVLAEIAEESRIWRQLCLYHFSAPQIQAQLVALRVRSAAAPPAELSTASVNWQVRGDGDRDRTCGRGCGC